MDIVPIVTRGDVDQSPFTDLSESGVFTSELEIALVDGRVDVAVHSLKDLPVSPAGGLPIVAVPLRDDPADALVSRGGLTLASLPPAARVGTSSPRRACLVHSLRPDVEVAPVRGNVDTRVRRLDEGAYDAIVLAVAGLARLGLQGRITERLDPRVFPPAPGQGALAVQAREGDVDLYAAVVAMDDVEARSTITAERECLSALGGGCSRPVGAHAWWGGGQLHVAAFVGSADGRVILRAGGSGIVPASVGRAAAEALLGQGAESLLA
jgi:hydroxymethylbilane synthase